MIADVAELAAVALDGDGWRSAARCRDADPGLFYPAKGQPAAPAKRICLACTVRTQCLAEALRTRDRHGIWGGYSQRERRRLDTTTSAPDADTAVAAAPRTGRPERPRTETA
ncbi:WhiB family transcriptional regulator [Amycolatopsis sp. H20-H5]|uniref:WhiB family transcriptional regulator n=1 Tax=Amycolatopsis sp. H20-H5 TaxID=3046309 RepID=UPI003FA3D917